MLLRRFTDFILKDSFRAAASAFLLAFIPLIGSVSIIIAALVTLRKGALQGAFVVIASSLPYLISYLVNPADQTGFIVGVFEVLIISNFLTWAFAVILREYGSWNITLEIAALIGIIFVVAVHVFHPDIQHWWEVQFTDYFSKKAELAEQLKTDASTITELEVQAIALAKRYATGFLTALVLFNALLQVMLARWWQAAIFNPGGLRKELHNIRLSYVSGAVFLVILVLAFFNVNVVLDSEPVVFALFGAAGLSLMHYLISFSKAGWVWLSLLYITIIWLFPISVMIMAFIALFDTWVDFRKKAKQYFV